MLPKDVPPKSLLLSEKEFEGTTFRTESAFGVDLSGTKFIDCTFEQCQLSSVKIDGAVLQTIFRNSKIEGVNFFTAKRSMLSLAFEACLIRHSSFADLKLHNIKFTKCKFQNVDFSDADLSGADFSNAAFEDCVFRNTNLSTADFRGASGYVIDPTQNKLRHARFSSPDVLNLLLPFDISID